MKKPDKQNNNLQGSEWELKVRCPYCGSDAVFAVDPKKIADKKTIYICKVCNQPFEHERKNFS